MNLSSVLLQHTESPAPQQLAKNLGDGFLLQHNRTFREVREKTLALGFSYSDRPEQDYLSFPMGQLENLLKRKLLPYLDNVTPLQNLMLRTAAPIEWDHVVDNLRPNYVFHESCHAIARSFSAETPSLQFKITAMLLEESFANTCEFFAIADAQSSIHRLFLEMNSYFVAFENRTHLNNAIEKNGRDCVFQFMLLCYLHSQFLHDSFNEGELKKIFDLCDLKNTSEVKTLKALGKNVFLLNPRFRSTTTEMYLRLNGIHDPIQKALNFSGINLIAQDSALKTYLQKLASVFR